MKSFAKTLIFLFICSLSFTYAQGQASDLIKVEQQFFTAYTKNSRPAWKIATQQLAQNPSEMAQLVLAKGYYGAAGTAMGNRDEDLAEEMLDKAEEVAQSILAKNKKSPEINALMSVIYGMRIGLSPMKGMFLGSKSSSAAAKGIKLAPENAFTNYVKGSYLYYTPSMFGGDVKKSITFLEKSKGIYEQAANQQTWEYINLLTLLGQAYHDQEEFSKAKTVYETALKVAPDFNYIKTILLPRTEKSIKKVQRA